MKSLTTILFTTILLAGSAMAADDVAGAIHGTIQKIDTTSKTVAVKTSGGMVYTLQLTKDTAVHGANAVAATGKASWHGMETGTEVIAHYTQRGGQKTIVELDRVGKGGMAVTRGTIESISRDSKTIAIRTSDGAVKSFQLTTRAAKYTGATAAGGTKKGTRVAVYSTETTGKKVAHFFEKV
jgi:hypothetical protein